MNKPKLKAYREVQKHQSGQFERFHEEFLNKVACLHSIPRDVLMNPFVRGYSVQSGWNHQMALYFVQWLSILDQYRRGELHPWERLDIRQIEGIRHA